MTALRLQLLSVKAAALALAAAVDAALAPDKPKAAPASADGACAHVNKLPAPAMGRPDAWVCGDCGEGGDA